MKACGLIVEYNPLHNGHLYHIQEAKKISNANCIIAVMSGSFLQRGEPAIIDKFHRTKTALNSGVDIVIELPYRFAVQSSELFAKGAIQILNKVKASSMCFGSESGNINNFITSYQIFKEKESIYTETLKDQLKKGVAFPQASKVAYEKIGLTSSTLDLSKPNNVLGFSYVKSILENYLPMQPLTIKRTKSNYHEEAISGSISSATSIRKQLLAKRNITQQIQSTVPAETMKQLEHYKYKSTIWHTWENYFTYVHYRILTTPLDELRSIQGVDEGLESRLIQTAKVATSFNQWMEAMKTKRYTWTRLQRMFVHILTNTKKEDFNEVKSNIPYVRILGLTNIGRKYLRQYKKSFNVPLITQLSRNIHPMLSMDEKASNAYYSVLPAHIKNKMKKQELDPPILV